jgi:hypothetical protein
VAWVLIDAEGVVAVHDRVLNPGELDTSIYLARPRFS